MKEIFQGRDLSVAWYDRIHPPGLAGSAVAGDISFYLKAARSAGGKVLELGCGTGRVALPLARAGFDVTGLDRSPHMLKLARIKASLTRIEGRLKLVRGNMARFDLGSRCRLVIIPFRAFQHLLTGKEQRSCLKAIRRHLHPWGRLIVDLFDPRLDFLHPGAAFRRSSRVIRDPVTDRRLTIRVLTRRTDPVLQIMREIWEFSLADARGRVVSRSRSEVALRWTYRTEMRLLLELAGFEPEACFGDFLGGPSRYGAEQIWVARRGS